MGRGFLFCLGVRKLGIGDHGFTPAELPFPKLMNSPMPISTITLNAVDSRPWTVDFLHFIAYCCLPTAYY